MSRCLVLGGGGFIGLNLVQALLGAGHAVRVFDRPESAATLPREVEFFAGDFSTDSMNGALDGCEVVFHLISTTLPKTSNDDPIQDLENNVAGTLRLLEAARAKGIRKIVFASSGGTVYGIPQQIPISEKHATDPLCAYGIGKLAIEKYLALYQRLHGLSYCVLRLSNPYGIGQFPNGKQGAVAAFSDKALKGEMIDVWGDGSVVRDYVYISDVISAFLRAMDYEGEPRVFNIGSGVGVSLNELLDVIGQACGHELLYRHLPKRAFDVPVNVLDVSRAAEHLGWKATVPLRSGVETTLAWLKKL